MTTTFTAQPITLYICDTCEQVVSGNAAPLWGGRHWDTRCAPVLHCKGAIHKVEYAPVDFEASVERGALALYARESASPDDAYLADRCAEVSRTVLSAAFTLSATEGIENA